MHNASKSYVSGHAHTPLLLLGMHLEGLRDHPFFILDASKDESLHFPVVICSPCLHDVRLKDWRVDVQVVANPPELRSKCHRAVRQSGHLKSKRGKARLEQV